MDRHPDLAILQELGIEGVDHDRGQLLELDAPQGRGDVLLYVSAVGGVGGGTDGAMDGREPLFS